MLNRVLIWSLVMMIFVGQSTAELHAEFLPSPYTWEKLLHKVGGELGIYFTIEHAKPRLESLNGLANFWQDANIAKKECQNVDDFLKFLKQSDRLAPLAFEQDERHPNVIHVIDKRLIGLKDYAVEQKIDFQFAGIFGNRFYADLHKQVPQLTGPLQSLFMGLYIDDHTIVEIDVKSTLVRQLLTDAMPIECYNTVLWVTETVISEEEKPRTRLGFLRLRGFHDEAGWPWPEWLNQHGQEYGCQFTIETIYRSSNDPEVCPAFFGSDEKFESLDSLLKELTKRVPYITIVRDKKRPEIIHLIDRELLNLSDYSLTHKLDLEYRGTPDDLVAVIADRVDSIEPAKTHGMQYLTDPQSQLTVEAKNSPIRNLLTDCVPPDTTRSVIWRAYTWIREDKTVTRIGYDWLGLYDASK